MSSRREDRLELRVAMDYCREGDEIVVWKLDRFGRYLRELIDLVNELRKRGVEFVSLRENIDTTTPGGKLVFHVFGAVAAFERDLILERTMAGLEAARTSLPPASPPSGVPASRAARIGRRCAGNALDLGAAGRGPWQPLGRKGANPLT